MSSLPQAEEGQAATASASRLDRGEPVLVVENLVTEFVTDRGVVHAVRDVSFRLEASEKLAIVGESGCGKSALALSILGLIEPPGRTVRGRVLLGGREISSISEKEMQSIRGRKISLIFQDPMTALDPVKTIGAQLVEALHTHQPHMSRRTARQRSAELLREVEVPHADRRMDDYPHQYSGGMRQRVMIAIALANEPDVVIADEPTTALDVTTQAQVLELLNRAVTTRQTSVILITHNFGIVAEFCDTVLVMYAGRIVERASADEVFESPIHPYTEALLKSVPRPDRLEQGPLAAIPGFPPSLIELPDGCSFEPRCPLGNGDPRCIATDPPFVELGPLRGAECHYSRERATSAARRLGRRRRDK